MTRRHGRYEPGSTLGRTRSSAASVAETSRPGFPTNPSVSSGLFQPGSDALGVTRARGERAVVRRRRRGSRMGAAKAIILAKGGRSGTIVICTPTLHSITRRISSVSTPGLVPHGAGVDGPYEWIPGPQNAPPPLLCGMAGTQPSQRTRHDLYEEQKLRQVRNKLGKVGRRPALTRFCVLCRSWASHHSTGPYWRACTRCVCGSQPATCRLEAAVKTQR
jgi:hypothetical protein